MPEQRVVVEVDLGVERVHLAVLGEDEGIDLGQRCVHFEYALTSAIIACTAAPWTRRGNADAERQLARLERPASPNPGSIGLLQDLLRRFRGHFFDVHAAGGRRHQDGLALPRDRARCRGTVPFDRQRFFHQEALDHAPFRAGLMRDQCHAQDLRGDFARFGRVLGELDAAAFAAASRVNLRLDYDTAAESRGPPLPLRRRVNATLPRGTGTPYRARIALAWYSWIFMGGIWISQL